MDFEENNQDFTEPTNFDEAELAAAQMFAADDEQGEEPPPGDLPPEQSNPNGNPPPGQPPPQMPPQIPPQMQQPPPELLLQRAFGELQALKAENDQLKKAMTQMSDANKENVMNNAMAEKPLEFPTLDLNTLAFDDETTLKEKQGKYAQDMAQYIQATMMKDLSPFIQQAKEGIEQKQKNEIITSLSALPELQDFQSMLPQIDKILANNKALSGSEVPLDEKYIMAYLIASGINSKNRAKENAMTPEKFMQYYQSNPDLKDLIDKQRLAEIKGNQDVPPMSPSNGAVNAALNIPKEPTNFDEALELTRKFFN